MINSIWNDLCQQPTLTVNRQLYSKILSDSTTQLQQCIEQLLIQLNNRAIVLTRCANFATALRDAAAMQEISPLSPLGYLQAANIYSEQGRQQAVIDICNEGLSIVDVNDPGYSKLQQVKTDAMQRANCRIDFISRLPLGIVRHTLFPMMLKGWDGDLLNGTMQCPYLDVSKMWFDQAIQAHGGGFQFEVYDKESCTQLTRYAQYTKAIHVQSWSQGKWLFDLLRRTNLCSLRELKIKDLKDHINVDQLVSALKSVSNTLTHLTIWRSRSEPTPTQQPKRKRLLLVADILINCPNLVMLDIAYEFNTDFSAVPLTMTWPQLTTLSLDHHDSFAFNGQFLAILKRFPSLEKLVLNPCIETQPMTIIQRYCPSMRDLQLITRTEQSPSPAILEQQDEDQGMHEVGGLEKIAVLGVNQHDDAWMDMRYTLKQHHNTLVHLELDMDYAGNNDEELFNLEFPCLKTLTLRCSGFRNACFGWWIVEKAPFLEELCFTTRTILSNPAILGIRPPSTLRKLKMDLAGVAHLDDPAVIARYLDQFSEEENSLLKDVKICFGDSGDIPATVVAAICRLKHIHHLSISFSPLWKQYQVDNFTDMLAEGCPNLLSLEFQSTSSLSEYAITNLKRLEYLRHLAFYMDDPTINTAKYNAFRSFSQLKFIRLFWIYGSPDYEFLGYIKRCRPDIKIVSEKLSPNFFF
ncbi:predicted protein [Lichtheimia corymbifera JMRC:FSU:9682]|uniref:F-box domain-containing protein n=1 Tax=Lichtheimia corymbifera JMRC:FSU:9682 TaxID=1263082 RepID=A0A068RYX5_9FUNG|nr:predicted protein [Lichtheimia corymbifera JMRC:FSU:9682]